MLILEYRLGDSGELKSEKPVWGEFANNNFEGQQDGQKCNSR